MELEQFSTTTSYEKETFIVNSQLKQNIFFNVHFLCDLNENNYYYINYSVIISKHLANPANAKRNHRLIFYCKI